MADDRASGSRDPGRAQGPRRGRGRTGIIILLIISLLATGITRTMTDDLRGNAEAVSGSASLTAMNSFALALLLGGLRGPLVMFLWTSSEAQKSENNLEDFDTKVEWIRLLQPEFDTVHIFQIWNKAYNISVKMTSLQNKYATILDALDYAQKVDTERPNNINILTAIGGIYFDKLGGSAEKAYYRQRVRDQSLQHPDREKNLRGDPSVHRQELPSLVDAQFHVLPKYTTPPPGGIRLVDPADPTQIYDGSDLQWLKDFEPYPYGVSPYAIAYSYFKRSQILQNVGKQRHAQLSDLVVDSRPALTMKSWLEEEWERGRRAELDAFGQPNNPNADRITLEMPVANVPLNQQIIKPGPAEEAIYSYNRAVELSTVALAEYDRHTARYKTNLQLYESHRETIRAEAALCAADRDFLKALVAPADQKDALRTAAAQEYQQATVLNQLMVLRYYTNDAWAEKVFPKGYTRANINTLPPQQVGPVFSAMAQFMRENQLGAEYQEDLNEYQQYLSRAGVRLRTLQGK